MQALHWVSDRLEVGEVGTTIDRCINVHALDADGTIIWYQILVVQ